VQEHRRAGRVLHRLRGAEVIEVRVGVQDGGGPEPVPRERRENPVRLAARIHDDRLAGLLVAEDRAVALKAHRETFEDHASRWNGGRRDPRGAGRSAIIGTPRGPVNRRRPG
jgi:hypothetical protein